MNILNFPPPPDTQKIPSCDGMTRRVLCLYTDGWARGNPWIAGLGVYITDTEGHPIARRYKSLGEKTNNQAEYLALLYGIQHAIELGATEIRSRLDSQLVVEQVAGRYKTKDPELRDIQDQIRSALDRWWGIFGIEHIRREYNTEADRLSNVAMDEGER